MSEFTQGTVRGGGGWLYAQSVGNPYVGQLFPSGTTRRITLRSR
jgi:hypothetical protein